MMMMRHPPPPRLMRAILIVIFRIIVVVRIFIFILVLVIQPLLVVIAIGTRVERSVSTRRRDVRVSIEIRVHPIVIGRIIVPRRRIRLHILVNLPLEHRRP